MLKYAMIAMVVVLLGLGATVMWQNNKIDAQAATIAVHVGVIKAQGDKIALDAKVIATRIAAAKVTATKNKERTDAKETAIAAEPAWADAAVPSAVTDWLRGNP